MSRSTAVDANARGPAAAGNPAAAGPRPARNGGRRWRGGSLRKNTELTILLAPALVLFVGFVLVPIVIAAYYSLFNWSGLRAAQRPHRAAGTTRYAFGDPVFVQAIEHTLILTVAPVVIQGPLSASASPCC